jgi:hypothetical protein
MLLLKYDVRISDCMVKYPKMVEISTIIETKKKYDKKNNICFPDKRDENLDELEHMLFSEEVF